MEGFAGVAILAGIFWLIGALVILSIAIDCARLLRRANKIIDNQEQQTKYLAAISTSLVKAASGDNTRAA